MPRSPLDFTDIPSHDGIFVHFDPKSSTYLVQAFFKATTLESILKQTSGPSPNVHVTVNVGLFNDVRDRFLERLLNAPDVKKTFSDPR